MKRIISIIVGLVLIFSLGTVQIFAFESAFEESFDSNSSKLNFTGSLDFYTRVILDNIVNSTPSLDLDLDYQKADSDLKATLKFNEEGVKIEEAFISLYYNNFDLVVGKKKVVWGKGDKLHVIDNLNGEELTDFINQDYLDRQIAEEMIKLNYYLGTGTIEFVYTPQFTPNKLAREGNWVTDDVNNLQEIETSIMNNVTAETALSLKPKLEEILNFTDNKFEAGQLGLRYTNSKGGYDYGFSLYQGKMKRPSMNKKVLSQISDPKITTEELIKAIKKINPHYDRVTVLGSEFSSVIAGINSRAELAYYMTKDTTGDDPTVHNHKLAWIIGGDKDLPLHNLNLNFQVKSELILNDDQIKGQSDIDYNQDNNYLTNLLVLKVGDKFKNETILPQISVVYNLEGQDYMLDNQLEFLLKDDTSCKINYKLFAGDEGTTFGQFKNNDYLSLSFEYDF